MLFVEKLNKYASNRSYALIDTKSSLSGDWVITYCVQSSAAVFVDNMNFTRSNCYSIEHSNKLSISIAQRTRSLEGGEVSFSNFLLL